MDREYLEDYEQREKEEYNRLVMKTSIHPLSQNLQLRELVRIVKKK